MNSQRLAMVTAVIAAVVGLIYLLLWLLMWRVLATQPLPLAAQVVPLDALGILLCAGSLLLASVGASGVRHRPLAGFVLGLFAFILLEHLLGLRSGIEQYVFGERVRAVLGGETPGRPGLLVTIVVLFLATGLLTSRPDRAARFEMADVWFSAALCLGLTVVLTYLYQSETQGALTAALSNTGLVGATVLVLLACGGLSLNPNGAVAALRAANAGGAALRRLLPAAVLAPVLLGLMQFLSVKSSVLDLSLALALTVTANIVVFLVLLSWVARLLNQVQAEQRGEMLERESRAKEEGMTDMLTGLLNRRGWELKLKLTEDACRAGGGNACIVAIDLDGLKRINDTLGHAHGDAFIKRAANALRAAARRDDHLARLGGDEFAYLAVGCEPEHAKVVTSRLSAALDRSEIPASLGYAMRDLAGSLSAAFHEADQAMYQHKRARKAQAPKTPAATG